MKSSYDLIIIGGGLTGLTLAHLLQAHSLQIAILEARPRLGGRIHTLYPDQQAPLEMGATWLGSKHQHLVRLLEQLGVETFPQRLGESAIYEPISTSPPQLVSLPANEEPSFRIAGGSSALIEALAGSLNKVDIRLGYQVRQIDTKAEGLAVHSDTESLVAPKVVSTLPPRLLMEQIDLKSALPEAIQELALQTHTWMGESIKIALTYPEPFWRREGLSGTIFSSVGPFSELYDHSDVADHQYGLKGFLNSAFWALSQEERKERVLNQLRRYYGDLANGYLQYQEAVWRNDPYTFAPYEGPVFPHQHNGASAFRQSFLNGSFFLAGSETAPQFPGYMDGAVQSAHWVAAQLLGKAVAAD